MRKILFLVIIISASIHWVYGQSQQEVVIENGVLTVNGYQFVSEVSIDKLDKLLNEAGKVVRHKKKKFKDRHHGTRHVIPKYVEIIYNKSGLVFKGSDENEISELQINFRSKELTEKYVLIVLEKEYEFSKNYHGINLSKTQHRKAYKEIYLNTFEPWTEHQFSGNLLIESQKVTSGDSIFNLNKPNEKLFKDAFFTKNAFNQEFRCIIPASVIVVGFCECFSNKIRMTLFGDDMRLQNIKYSFGQK